jgi:hypothetical protein
MTTTIDMSQDAGRSAVAALRYLRNGQEGAALLLVAGMDGAELEHFAGACLALANAALQVADTLSEQVTLSTGRMAATGDDILGLMMLGEYATPHIADFIEDDNDETWHD